MVIVIEVGLDRDIADGLRWSCLGRRSIQRAEHLPGVCRGGMRWRASRGWRGCHTSSIGNVGRWIGGFAADTESRERSTSAKAACASSPRPRVAGPSEGSQFWTKIQGEPRGDRPERPVEHLRHAGGGEHDARHHASVGGWLADRVGPVGVSHPTGPIV